MSYIKYFYEGDVDSKQCACEWKHYIPDDLHFSDEIVEHISEFIYRYIKLQKELTAFLSPTTGDYNIPEGFIAINDALNMIFNDVRELIKEDETLRPKIINEYYNILTGKRGILLEGNIMIEDGKFVNKPEFLENFIKNALKVIDHRIKWILEPDERNKIERQYKLKRILK